MYCCAGRPRVEGYAHDVKKKKRFQNTRVGGVNGGNPGHNCKRESKKIGP